MNPRRAAKITLKSSKGLAHDREIQTCHKNSRKQNIHKSSATTVKIKCSNNLYGGIVSKFPTNAWNKAKISPYTPLKMALSGGENHSTNNAFWLVESRDAHRLAAPLLCDCCIALPLWRTRRAGRGKTLKICRLIRSPILLAELFHGVCCKRWYDILLHGAHSYLLARERIDSKKCEGEEMDTKVLMLDQFRDSAFTCNWMRSNSYD